MKRFRIQLVWAFIVFVCGVSLMGLTYIIFSKPDVHINPGITVSNPSPVAAPMQPMRSTSHFAHPSMHHSPYILPAVTHPTAPAAAMSSSHGLYLTSSATSHMVGGGGNGHGIATTSGGSSNRGISYSSAVTMPVTSFVAVASSRQVAEPEAQDAPELASVSSRRAPGPPNVTPPDEHQLVEHPIGNPVWPLLLMVIGYAAYGRQNKKRRLAA